MGKGNPSASLRTGRFEPLVSCKVADREVGTKGYLRLISEQIRTTKLGSDPSTSLRTGQAETVYEAFMHG